MAKVLCGEHDSHAFATTILRLVVNKVIEKYSIYYLYFIKIKILCDFIPHILILINKIITYLLLKYDKNREIYKLIPKL